MAIVLEYCPDGDLNKLIGTIKQEECPRILEQIAKGLVYLHDQKVIHRDIKPENILMKGGVAKIADFGSSKIMTSSGAKTYTGTQFYSAPEVFNEENYDSKADVWSFGIVSLELLVGQKVSSMVKGLLAPALREDFPSEKFLNKIKDQRMRELVRKMLKKNPKERLSSE